MKFWVLLKQDFSQAGRPSCPQRAKAAVTVVYCFLLPTVSVELNRYVQGNFLLLQECPYGIVDEDTFKNIYAQFFPQGGLRHYYSIAMLLSKNVYNTALL